MIYTVTFNPSLDYIVRLDSFTAGEINRVNYEQVLGGGKGINVSIVLGNLGHESTALGFTAGFTGEEIKRQLDDFGVKHDFVQLPEGFTRINVKVKADKETEINGQGPDISEAKREELFEKLDKLSEGDTLVLAGSIPKTLPDDIYEKIMARLEGRGIRIIVDAEKKLLLNVLKYHPFLIKPNNHELGDMFGVKLTTDEESITYAKELQEKGASTTRAQPRRASSSTPSAPATRWSQASSRATPSHRATSRRPSTWASPRAPLPRSARTSPRARKSRHFLRRSSDSFYIQFS